MIKTNIIYTILVFIIIQLATSAFPKKIKAELPEYLPSVSASELPHKYKIKLQDIINTNNKEEFIALLVNQSWLWNHIEEIQASLEEHGKKDWIESYCKLTH